MPQAKLGGALRAQALGVDELLILEGSFQFQGTDSKEV